MRRGKAVFMNAVVVRMSDGAMRLATLPIAYCLLPTAYCLITARGAVLPAARKPFPRGSAAAHSRSAAGGSWHKQLFITIVSLRSTFKKSESHCGRITDPRYRSYACGAPKRRRVFDIVNAVVVRTSDGAMRRATPYCLLPTAYCLITARGAVLRDFRLSTFD